VLVFFGARRRDDSGFENCLDFCLKWRDRNSELFWLILLNSAHSGYRKVYHCCIVIVAFVCVFMKGLLNYSLWVQ